MSDIKFSCPQCGQHISCDAPWSGHQIQCPACQGSLVVPRIQTPPAATEPVATSPAPGRPKLSAGSTQVARPTAPGPAPRKQPVRRPPKTPNPLVKFAVIGVVLAALAWAGFTYLPGLVNQAQELGTSKTPLPGPNPAAGGAGPLGEVNGAMDVSDALDGGSQARPRPAAAKPPPTAARPPAAPTTNAAAKSGHRRPH
jgi:hypothetical protein